jgi:hypothetical protein
MLLIIKRFKDEALMVRKDSDIDTIKDTMKLIQLLVTSLNGDKILLSLRIEVIGIYFFVYGTFRILRINNFSFLCLES